jgi:hypothetical protein
MRSIPVVALGLAVVAAVTVAMPSLADSSAPPPPAAFGHWTPHYATIDVPHQPGPAADDKVGVLEVGNPAARQVLVLAPGWFGNAGDFREVATDLADRLPDTQVWAAGRREAALNDESGFAAGPAAAAGYYLGGQYRTQSPAQDSFVGDWGLAAQLSDLHQVVLAAGDHGRRQVVLGGHSWGASTALAYAGWDFDGRRGYRDLAGIVMIDGGLHDAFAGEGPSDVYRVTPAQAEAWLNQIKAGAVFDQSATLTPGHPETLAVLIQLAAVHANTAPHAPSTLQQYLPTALRPPTQVTNAGLLGWLLDTHYLVPDLSVTSGHLTATGDWQDTGPTPISRVAATMASWAPAALEWYWPNRLTLDLEAVDPDTSTPTTRLLGLRLWHADQVDVPLYVFETGLTKGSVFSAAHWVVAHSRIDTVVYAQDQNMRHLDPLMAAPAGNTMLPTLVPFLRRLDHR